MDSTVYVAENDGNSLMDNFGIASLVVVLGVSLSWFVLKLNTGKEEVVLPTIPAFAWSTTGSAVTGDESKSLLERAELAFAAGNVGSPERDSALYYYQEALLADSNDTAAAEGLTRVVSYLLGTAEGAVFRNDWTAAQTFAELVLDAQPDNIQARNLLQRVERYQQVERFTTLASQQLTRGRLTTPKGDNAVSTYRRILRLDPGNETATQGINMVAQRLLASAQTAAFAGNVKQANRLIQKVKSVAPQAAGLAETQQLTSQWRQISSDQSIQTDLMAAANAMTADQLVSPKANSALTLFKKVLRKDPKSEAAKRGLALVAQELVNRAWTQVRSQDLASATQTLKDAEVAGAASASLTEVRDEIAYQNRIANARLGRVDLSLPVSKLVTIRKTTPIFPRRAANKEIEGWAEVEFLVSPTGEVIEAKVSQSSDSIFDRSALSAINEWVFEPYIDGGRAVPVRSGVRFTFQR